MKRFFGLIPILLCLFFACDDSDLTNRRDERNHPSFTEPRLAPTDLTSVRLLDPTTLFITWNRNAKHNKSVIILVDGSIVADISGAQTAYELKGLIPGKTYKIKVWNSWGMGDDSPSSNEITVKPGLVSSLRSPPPTGPSAVLAPDDSAR